MKKMVKYLSYAVIFNASLSTAIFAAESDKYQAINQCDHVKRSIDHIISKDQLGSCRGDLSIASAYIKATKNELLHNKIDKALETVKFAKHELNEIGSNRSNCTHVSQESRIALSETILLESEINILERLRRAFTG
ncbi:hypothetical protein [Legionella septentrionalis]|uniref:hypothetical protein n=1 Tax=Legionella septentrionalis TaxID=2498109 RepID=UPI000F8E687A|nr:hypothetical protein [Legionella septentrionalis]RUQ96645.1 hypothetical protein ELY11_07450 [Legionella septentrionalis]